MRLIFIIISLTIMVPSLMSQETQRLPQEGINSYCQGYQPVIRLLKGDTLIGECDSLYVINTLRYKLYEQSRQYIMSMDTLQLAREIQSLQQEMKHLKSSGRAFSAQYDSLEASYKNHLTDQQERMKRLQAELSQARDELDLQRIRLRNLSEDLRMTSRANLRKNLLFGGGGLLTGIIIGLIIPN